MTYAKHIVEDQVRFCRIKRRGPKNCRVVWLETGEDYLVPRHELEECSAEEAGATESVGQQPISPPPVETALTGQEVCRLMRNYQITIRELADRLGISADQVRQVRRDGIEGVLLVHEWKQAITEAADREDAVAA